ncbi:SDR family NAD(P)-dependent oxidoreductase [Manganibacter manganicus]|uniref:Short-chain dehydrogenase n=1 Tax=Manganibacter manganicus TaxID=1873176 RepID=A0A1V8RTF7_9HYPH|nr:SDR family NAD(P)-dependent oxidoreductase [Pseudaminobacter manganicus]OQM76319.1 short-chain dehydrogenase [Pseudaminobacter manganicus]
MTGALEGRHVVVTGGTGALGSAVVARLLDEGAFCHVPNTHAEPPAHFPFAKHERVRLANNIYLADSAATDAFYSQAPELWASINLAGGFARAPFEKTESAAFAEMMETNARTTFLCSRAAVRMMHISNTAGRIVNIAARPGLDPRRGGGMVAYTASKAAVAAMTVALAEEVKARGILVNAVAPSTLDTPANREAMPDADFGKWVSLDAAAEVIVHLASPANRAVSGALVPLYGRA